jgi:hypothetical protein
MMVAVIGSLLVGVRSSVRVDADDVTSSDKAAFIDRYLDVADQIDPLLAGQLRSMCQLDPEGFEIVLRRLGPMLSGLADLRGDEPELYQRKIRELHLEATVAALAVEARRAAMDDSPQNAVMRGSLHAQLEAMVRAQVMTNLDNRVLFAQRLHEHLEHLDIEIEADQANLDAIIQDRIKSLTTQE